MQSIISTLTPAINARMLTRSQTEAFERGLTMLERVPQVSKFVRDTRKFKDYHRKVKLLLTYLQTLAIPPVELPKRNVGRLTKEAQKAYNEALRKKQAEEAKRSLFPELASPSDVQPLTYKGIVANPNGDSIASTMLHLNDIKIFLSESLQERVNSVRDLRNEMAQKAEKAKAMAEANNDAAERNIAPIYSEQDIAEYATRAAVIESDILPSIYRAVDEEMGEVYLRLSPKTGDPQYIEETKKLFSAPPESLRTLFRPFYDKAQERDNTFADRVAAKIAYDRPEVKAERDRAAKHKAEADAMIKYILRKDKPASKARVKGLKERIDKLRSEYSDILTPVDFEIYEAVLQKTKEECEKK